MTTDLDNQLNQVLSESRIERVRRVMNSWPRWKRDFKLVRGPEQIRTTSMKERIAKLRKDPKKSKALDKAAEKIFKELEMIEREGVVVEERSSGQSPNKEEIREVFLANGFSIKPGDDDLKQYAYDAARELLSRYGGRTLSEGCSSEGGLEYIQTSLHPAKSDTTTEYAILPEEPSQEILNIIQRQLSLPYNNANNDCRTQERHLYSAILKHGIRDGSITNASNSIVLCESVEPENLGCPKCGADRSNEPCAGNLMDCAFKGYAQSSEWEKVPSKEEVAEIWEEAHKPFGGAPFLMSHVEYSRALLNRYVHPAAPEGWQLVPKEPSRKMVLSGEEAWDKHLDKRLEAQASKQPFVAYPSEETLELCSRVAYRAMLEDAPKFGEGE